MKFLTVFLIFLVLNSLLIFKTRAENEWLIRIAKPLPHQVDSSSWRQTDSCKCGIRRNFTERIVGGVVTEKNAYPWMGAIVYIGDKTPKLLCGLSIINDKYLLSAAHCVDYIKSQGIEKFRLYLGTNNLNDTETIILKIQSVLTHPKFNPVTKSYDVALIKLKSPLEFSTKVSPICIAPQTGSPYAGKEAIVVGWGATVSGGNTATMQMQALVNVTTNKSCQKSYEKQEKVKITPSMICASSPGADSCQGDSGGPLFLPRKGSSEVYEQIGIVSFGSGCADKRYPGVYGRTGKSLSWIKSATKDAIYCSMK